MDDDEFEWDTRNDREDGVTFEIHRLVFDDPNAIDRLDLDETDEDRELITGFVGDVLLTVITREPDLVRRALAAHATAAA